MTRRTFFGALSGIAAAIGLRKACGVLPVAPQELEAIKPGKSFPRPSGGMYIARAWPVTVTSDGTYSTGDWIIS